MAATRDDVSATGMGEHADGLFSLDQDLQICGLSPGAAGLLGWADGDLLGRPIDDIIGLSLELRTLKMKLAMAVEAGPLHWRIHLRGRTFLVQGSVDRVDGAIADRRILLSLSDAARVQAHPSRLAQLCEQNGILRYRLSWKAAAWLALPALAPLGFWLAALSGESSAVERDGPVSDPPIQRADPNMSMPGETMVPGNEASFRRFVGQIHPGVSVAGIAPLDGSITKLEAPDFGVFVEQGDLLITLDPSEEAEKGLREAKIAVIEAKTELLKLQNWSTSSEMREAERSVKDALREVKRAELERDRTRQLYDDGIVAASEYETAAESLESAQSQYETTVFRRDEVADQATGEVLEVAEERFKLAEAAYEALQRSQRQREVRAPISGIMLPAPSTEYKSSDLSVGQDVEKGTSLFLVGNLDEIVVQTSVSEFDIDLIEIGQKATITSPAQPGFKAEGEVVSISQISSSFGDMGAAMGGYTPPPSRYDVAVKIATGEQAIDGKIRIGMTVDVEIDTAADVVASQ